jgi:transposase-like protein
MSKVPQRRSAEFKFKLALEAMKGDKSIAQLAKEHQMHPKQIQRWRDLLLAEGEEIYIHKASQKKSDPDKEQLISVINQLSAELDFLKKKLKRCN